MNWFIPAEIAQLTVGLVLALVFFYHYWYDRQRCLLLWMFSWLAWSFKLGLDMLIFFGFSQQLLQFANLFCWLAGGYLLAYGIFAYLHKPQPRWWGYGSAALLVWLLITVSFTLPAATQMVPLFFFLGVIFISTGITFLRSADPDIVGRRITGGAFLLWGFHLADYPLLAQNPIIAPWGYLIAAIFTLFTANGILLVYYQKMRRDLWVSEQRYRLLAENATDIIYRYQLQPIAGMDYISPSAALVTGYSMEELYTNTEQYLRLIHPEDVAEFQNLTHPFLFFQQDGSMRWVRKDKRVIWVEQRCSPVYDSQGQLLAYEGIIRDITERKKAEEQIIQMDSARRHFLSNISHDLRTPITSISGHLEALIAGVFTSEEQQHYLRLVYNRVLNLNRLINDLFQLVQLEFRQVHFAFRPMTYTQLIEQIASKYRFDVESAGLLYQIRRPSEHLTNHVQVQLDWDRLDQVLGNLMTNAIQHTPKGGSISIFFKIMSDREISIAVQDTGPGIGKKQLPFIFNRYYTSNAANAAQGTGLGLAIAQEIIHAHQGQIWVESTPNRGTTFTFTLPSVNQATTS